MKFKFSKFWLFYSVVFTLILAGSAEARDLQQASNTYLNTIKNIAQILSPSGLIVGGMIMQIPSAEEFGKRILKGGLVGCLVAFGAPSFVALMRAMFGSIS